MKNGWRKIARRWLAFMLAISLAVTPLCASASEFTGKDPAATEPVATEPVASEPVASEPVASEPVASELVASEPVASEPVASEPVASEPVASEPVASEPVASEPVASEPVVSEPAATEPAATEPVRSAGKQSRGMPLTSTNPNSRATTEENVICGVQWKLEGNVLTISKASALPENPDCACALGEMCEKYTNKDGAKPLPWDAKMSNVKTLVVESGVTELCNRVCNAASGLTSVSLPEGLTYIGERAFTGCTNLSSISLPSSLTYLGPFPFAGCTKLTVVDISNTRITSLGEKAFAGCANLTTLSIPGTVAKIDKIAFGTQSSKATAKLKTLNFGGTLAAWEDVKISSNDNPNLTDGTCTVYCTDGIWASGYTSAGTNMCYQISGETLSIRCVGAMQDFEQGAAPWHDDASGITKVVLESGITKVGANAFDAWSAIAYEFSGDFETLKANSNRTGNAALFGAEESEEDPKEEPEEEQAGELSGGIVWTFAEDGTLTISPAKNPETGYTSGQMIEYANNDAVPWKRHIKTITALVVESGVTNLGERTCNGAEKLTSISLPDGLKSIGNRCFSDCKALPGFTLPDSVQTIGKTAFNGCLILTEVDISNTGVTALGEKTFAACPALTTITLPKLTSIGPMCFGYSSGESTNSLTRVNYAGTGADWTNMEIDTSGNGNANQTDNKQLLKCTIYCTDGTYTLDSNYDAVITGKTGDVNYSLNIATGVMTLSGSGATASYKEKNDLLADEEWVALQEDIKELVVGDEVTALGGRLFSLATGLEKVTLPESGKIATIGTRCFSDCTSLKTINFPASITELGSVSFNGCTSLVDVDLSKTQITKLNSKTFAACSKLETITIPVITEIGEQCFGSSLGISTDKLHTVIFKGTGSQWTAMDVVTGGPSAAVQIDNKQLLKCTISCTDGTYTLDENYDAVLVTDEEPDENLITGKTGELNYSLDKTTGILTLSGTGATASYTERADFDNDTTWVELLKLVKEVVVEEGATALGNRLFTLAPILEKVTLPASLKSIGYRCFTDCYELREVVFSATSGELSLESLGKECAFNGCIKLETVDFSRTKITTLTRKTFAACPSLTTLYLPATVTSIAGEAFGDTKINDVNTSTSNLKALYFGGTLEDWDDGSIVVDNANDVLTGGTCTVYCADGIWIAGYTSADNLCYKLENGTLTIRCAGAMKDYEAGKAPWFEDADQITSVILESGMTYVGANAFDGCVNMITVRISDDITKVGQDAFADCENLTDVSYPGTDSQWQALRDNSESGNGPLFSAVVSSGYSGVCGDNARWNYEPETKTLTISGTGPMWDWHQGTYQTKTPWNDFKDEIEKIVIGYGITATGRYAFCYLGALKELVFETNDEGFTTVETIGGYGFCWNDTLEILRLPEGVRFLSGRAFSRVESITTVYLPSTLESVDMYAFMSNDDTVTISKVYYNGTKEDWANVYVSTQGSNDKYLLPDSDTEWVYLKEYAYYDDVDSTAWFEDAVYYLKDHKMIPGSGTFGVETAADMQWVLNVLYVRAGSSGAYVDGLDWARIKNIVAADTAATGEVSLSAMADILYRTTLYNGHLVDLEETTAAAWCKQQGYIAEQLSDLAADAVLTRAQAASILAAYLQSTNGSANRYDEMRDEMKDAYETEGGDGKMHILALHHAGTGKVGDSTLILMPGGEVMLIDTFRNDGWKNYLKATLVNLGIKKLDYLVLSHGHEDHDANLTDVIDYIYSNGYTVGNYWSAGDTTSDREKEAIAMLEAKGGVTIEKKLRAGQQRIIGSGENQVVVDILWPTASGASGDSNNGSLLMKLTYGDSSYITGGDLFLDGEAAILDYYKDNPDALKADVMKTNHHGSYSSNGSDWVDTIDPKALITHSDDTGDSAQCYEYSRDGKAWYSAGRDGGIMVVMDGQKNITVTTGYDTNLRENVYACGEKGHIYETQSWQSDENGHWRLCEGFWLCGAMETVQIHAGGTANCQHGKICSICGFEYTEKGDHDWAYTASGNVITATCKDCGTSGGTVTLSIADAAPVYDGTEKTVTVTSTVSGLRVPEVAYEGSRVNAGKFTASVTLGEAKAELEVTIAKRSATIVANDQSIAYGGTISATEITTSGLLEGHSATATLTPSTNAVTATGSITASAAVITADGVDVTANYALTYVDGKLTITAPESGDEENAEEVEEAIAELPATVEPDDEEAAAQILAAKAKYDALTSEEKSLVDPVYKAKLDALVYALTDYKVVKGDGSIWEEGEDGSVTFTANGPYSKFTGIEVDGKAVDTKYYTAKSGSTIITMKESYLKKLSNGKHTITVLYSDGEVSATFTVKEETVTPSTGDNSGIIMWSVIFFVSAWALVLLAAAHKKFAYKGKYLRR